LYGERGRNMVSSEFLSMKTIKEVAPHLVPVPIAWVTYETLNDVHFILCEFRNMTDELPNIEAFPAQMAELHRNGTSPNGKFGFPVTTYHGNTPINHGWHDTWELYFTNTTKVPLQMEQEAQGPNAEILDVSKRLFEKVVPRPLRPLETDGRSIKPALIHGDLWHGNVAMDANTGQPIIFDAASFYAYNECETPRVLFRWSLRAGVNCIRRTRCVAPALEQDQRALSSSVAQSFPESAARGGL